MVFDLITVRIRNAEYNSYCDHKIPENPAKLLELQDLLSRLLGSGNSSWVF